MARRSARLPKARKGVYTREVSRWRAARGVVVGAVVVVLGILAVGVWVSRQKRSVDPASSAWTEAREALKKGRAADAEKALARASEIDPSDPEPWLLRLELLRVEDRQIEAARVGWQAYESVPAASRRSILRALTLALLADTPEDVARTTLAEWAAADPDDLDARVALLQRIATSSRAGDPDRNDRVAALSRIVADHPDHVAAREALVLAMADAGEPPARGQAVLNAWPETMRDARYDRLAGRWNLEYEPRDDLAAIVSFNRALKTLPHDWRTRYRLARALRNVGKIEESQQVAHEVESLREALDPVALGRRLDADLANLDDPKSRLDLAALCERVGLIRLAEAWRQDAQTSPTVPKILGDRLSP